MPEENSSAIQIRRVASRPEYEECVRIEKETWGAQFSESVPSTILRIAQEVGGVTAAAFDLGGRMLGFVFGITGVRDGELAHWSDLLAVRPEARDTGIGRRLKLFQRDLLREIGVRTMYWTYDPLVARNAHLNLQVLGARVVEYRPNFYGEDTGSIIHAALGTDRFIVAWDLTLEDATPLLRDAAPLAGIVNLDASGTPVIRDLPDQNIVHVAIPRDIFTVLQDEPATARAWRSSTRAAFEQYLGSGYRVSAFAGSAALPMSTYLLRRS